MMKRQLHLNFLFSLLCVLISFSSRAEKVGIFHYWLNPDNGSAILMSPTAAGKNVVIENPVIPDEIEVEGQTYRVTEIYESAFESVTLKGKLTLSRNLVKINKNAFYEQPDLTGTLDLPESLEYIGGFAFNGCSGFTGKLELPKGLKDLWDFSFAYCTGFTGELVIPEGITEIKNGVFKDCTGLDGSPKLPSGLTKLGGSSFKNCTGLTGTLDLPKTLLEIGNMTFENCSGLSGSLVIPTSVFKIGMSAFEGCSGLTGDLVIPDNVQELEESAFKNCSGLNRVLSLPEGMTELKNNIFRGCSSLSGTPALPSSLRKIGDGVFADCKSLTGELKFPEGIVYIGDEAFAGCSGLEGEVVLPTTVESINRSIFNGCSGLKSIELHNKTTVIGANAFVGCDGLESVKSHSMVTPSVQSNHTVFGEETYKNAVLYVPWGAKKNYEASDCWGKFARIKEVPVLAWDYEPMVVEGRTWWYDASWYGAIEYGIRIGSKVTIDGVEWNKVYVGLHHKDVKSVDKPYDLTNEWLEFDEDSGLVAYIREDDGKIYSKIVDRTFSRETEPCAIMAGSLLFGNEEDQSALIYDFTSDTFTLGNEKSEDSQATFVVTKHDTEENSGKTYRRMLCSTEDSHKLMIMEDQAYFTQGIGVTGQISDYGTSYSIFYAPFYAPMTNGMELISLKYVTDSDNNVIYEGTGGQKLWELERNEEGMPDGLYYAGSDGKIHVIDNEGNDSAFDTEELPHTFQLAHVGDRVYGATAGSKFVYSPTPESDGDGQLFYLTSKNGEVNKNIVLDNTGGNHNKDPYGLAVYGDNIYVYDRNECVRKIGYDTKKIDRDHPSWLENNWINFYGNGWSYGCIKAGMQITEGTDADGNAEPIFWLAMKYNGEGLYRFKEAAVSQSGNRNSSFNKSFLVGMYSTSFFFDEANDHLYIYKEDVSRRESGIYRVKISELMAGHYSAVSFFSTNPPELIDGSPVRNEGSTSEHVGIPQLSADADGQYLYWCYRAPTSDDDYDNTLFKEKFDPTNPMHRTGIKRIKLGESTPKVEIVAEGADGYGVVAVNYKSADQGAVSDIRADDSTDGPVEYYNMQGIRVSHPQPGSIVIRKEGSKRYKILVR